MDGRERGEQPSEPGVRRLSHDQASTAQMARTTSWLRWVNMVSHHDLDLQLGRAIRTYGTLTRSVRYALERALIEAGLQERFLPALCAHLDDMALVHQWDRVMAVLMATEPDRAKFTAVFRGLEQAVSLRHQLAHSSFTVILAPAETDGEVDASLFREKGRPRRRRQATGSPNEWRETEPATAAELDEATDNFNSMIGKVLAVVAWSTSGRHNGEPLEVP